jgi:small-conductance mechanosensitive channel
MHHHARKKNYGLLAFGLAACLALGGCATTGSSLLDGMGSGGVDPRLTQTDDAKFFSKSGYQACAAGALTGILACAVSNSSNKAVCAVAVGVAACGVAMGANYYLDQRRSEYSNTDQRLAVISDDVREDTEKVIARTETARKVLADDAARIARIRQEKAATQKQLEQARKDVADVDKNIAVLRRDLSNMNDKVKQYQEVARDERANGAKRSADELDREIVKMSTRVAMLQKEVDGLYEQRSAITLG